MAKIEFEAREKARASVAESSEIQAYRKRVVDLSKVLGGLALKLAGQVAKRLDKLAPADDIPSSLSSAARATAAMAETALNSEAAVLGIDDLIGSIGRNSISDD